MAIRHTFSPARPAWRLAALLLAVLTLCPSLGAAQSPPAVPGGLTATAGDQRVTLAWSDPADASITRYEYGMRYAGVAWGDWIAIPGSDASTTSHTVTGLDNGTEYRFRLRAVNAAGASGNAPTAAPWYVAATPEAAPPPAPPATPDAVSVTRADGTLTASWQAVDGATSYHVTYSSDNGASWHLAALNHPHASITITGVDNAKTYIVGVRARNEHGDSGWRNSSATGPFVPPSPPATPDAVSVTRADGTLTASWQAVADATSYHVNYRADDDADWRLGALNHPHTSITISGVDNAKTYTVAVRARNEHGDSGWRNSPPAGPFVPPSPPATPGGLTAAAGDESVTLAWSDPADASITRYEYSMRYEGVAWGDWTAIPGSDANTTSHTLTGLDNGTEYRFRLRAVNASGASGNAPVASPWYVAATPAPVVSLPPPPATPGGLTATAGDQSITLAWNDPADTSITRYEYSMRYAGVAWGQWIAIPGSDADTTSHTLTGLDNGTEYRFRLRAVNVGGASGAAPSASPWYVAATPELVPPPETPGPITVTRADGTLTASWQAVADATSYHVTYRADSDDDWTLAALNHTATSITISGVDNAKTYTVRVRARNEHGDSGWRDSPAAGPYQPPTLTTTDETATGATLTLSNYDGAWYYRAEAASDGASAQAVTCNGPVNGGQTTISGLDPDTQYTITAYGECGGAAIASGSLFTAQNATQASLAVTSFDGTGATLTLEGWNQAWRLYHSSGNSSSCIDVAAGTKSATVTGLTPGRQYTYQAYDDTGNTCTTVITGAGVTFTVPQLTVTPGSTSAALTLSDWTGQWWYRDIGVYAPTADDFVEYTGQPCRGPAQGSALAIVTGLTSGYTHGFKAFSSYAECAADYIYANQNADDSRETGVLGAAPVKAGPIDDTLLSVNPISGNKGFRIVLGNWSASDGDWWYRVNVYVPNVPVDPHGEDGCRGPVTGGATQIDDANLPALPESGAYYIFTVYPTAGCHYSKIAAYARLAATAVTPYSLAVSNVTASTATLTLAGHTGNWHVKQTAPTPAGSCSAVSTRASRSLDGLTNNTAYTFTAYADATCSTLLASASFGTGVPGSHYSAKDISLPHPPTDIWSDGTTMWVEWFVWSLQYGGVLAYDLSTGNRATGKEFSLHADNKRPWGIWGDEDTIWVLDRQDTKVYAYARASQTRDTSKEFDLHEDNANPAAIWSDGTTIWVSDTADAKLYAYQLSDGTRDSAKDYDTLSAAGNQQPEGLWSDGTTMWVSDFTDVESATDAAAVGDRG